MGLYEYTERTVVQLHTRLFAYKLPPMRQIRLYREGPLVLLDSLPMKQVLIGRVLGALVAAPFGVYCGVILGTFGGSWGERFLGKPGIVIGVLLAVLSVTAIFISVGALIGGGISVLLARLVGRH